MPDGSKVAHRTCGFPGCDHPIAADGTSGMCRTHLHKLPFCQCRACRGAAHTGADRATVRALRAGRVRTVNIPAITRAGNGTVYAPVTIGCAPWETPNG